jgi:hypothetical protein
MPTDLLCYRYPFGAEHYAEWMAQHFLHEVERLGGQVERQGLLVYISLPPGVVPSAIDLLSLYA